MISKYLVGAACICLAVVSFNTSAALLERLGGLAYYDDEADLTWLADASYAFTSGYDTDLLMNWEEASNWAADLTIAGVSGWRLPDTLELDASCDYHDTGYGYGPNCTGSEMGNLFYNTLGNEAYSPSNKGPFSNVQSYLYWSATEFSISPDFFAYEFNMGNGDQQRTYKTDNLSTWAVQSGDVSAVPVPTAAWLFGSGLIGLIGIARRKKA